MSITISKWGNSLGIRIPAAVADALSIRNGDTMNYELKNDSIILSKKISSRQLFEEFYKKDFSQINAADLGNDSTVDFGDDVGGEVF